MLPWLAFAEFLLSSYCQMADIYTVFVCLVLLYKNTGILKKNGSLGYTNILQLPSIVFHSDIKVICFTVFLKVTLPLKSPYHSRVVITDTWRCNCPVQLPSNLPRSSEPVLLRISAGQIAVILCHHLPPKMYFTLLLLTLNMWRSLTWRDRGFFCRGTWKLC